MLTDFPKIECPFVRKTFRVNPDDFKKHGAKLGLREPSVYLAIDEINPGYEWVFDDPETFAVEKLDGTNIKIRTEAGRLVEIQNRLNLIDPLRVVNISKGNLAIIEGLMRAISLGYIVDNEEQAGELIGPKFNANPLQLKEHIWYPFEKALSSLRYKSFNAHEPTFENLSQWFQRFLKSMYYGRVNNLKMDEHDVMAEGVVFYNLKRKAKQQVWRAKLRRDMFRWFYDGQISVEDTPLES